MRRLGPLTARADRRMIGPDGDLLSVRLEDFKQAGAGPHRSRSGSTAVEPQLAGRLGTGTHRGPSVPAATRVLPAAKRADLGARQVVPAAVRPMPVAGVATPGRAPRETGTAPLAASGLTGHPGPLRLPSAASGRTGHPGPLLLPRVGRRPLAGAVSPATVWGSWTTKNRPRLRSGQECGRALNRRVVVRRAAPERAGRQGGWLVVEMLTVRRLPAHGVAPRGRAKCRLAARPLPVLGRQSHRLLGHFHQNKSWKGKLATRTVAATR